jgi:hypothetical protein
LRAVAQLFTVRSYQKDAIVVTEGDRLDLLNIILSGKSQAFWRLIALGLDPVGSTADELAKRTAEDTARWRRS